MKVKYVNVYSTLTGRREEVVETADRIELLAFLGEIFGRYGSGLRDMVMRGGDELNPHIWLLVNRERVTDLTREIHNGDVVVFSLPVCGG